MCAKQLYVKSKGSWVAVGGAGGDSAITVHDGPIPQPVAPIPQALEDAFGGYEVGLHFFKDAGSLVAITRQEYQTTITITGPSKSVAKIVKSEAGLPTPENPSFICQQEPDGKWMKLTSAEVDKPFGPPQMVDLFALTGGGADLTNYYTKTEIDSSLTALSAQFLEQTALDYVNSQLQALATVTQDALNGLDKKADKASVAVDVAALMAEDVRIEGLVKSTASTLMNSIMEVKTDTYTKQEVDDKLEADKDFSIANDNILLASITSLQEIVSNLGTEIGTGQIDVLDAIRDVEIEPSAIKFTESVTSPIKWKGGLSLAPTKEGDTYHLAWNNGTDVGNLLTSADLGNYALLDSYGQVITASQMKAETFVFTKANTTIGYTRFPDYPDGRLGIQINGPSGEVQIIAYVSDLTGPHVFDTTHSLVIAAPPGDTANRVCWKSGTKTFGLATLSDLSGYAKQQDNTQNLLAKVVTAQGYGFGDKNEPPVALTYTDTGEGYNERLVLATGASIDYVVMKSDLDELQGLLPRMERLESKSAPVVDLSSYVTQLDADSRYESKEAGDLLRGQMQTVFDSIYTRAEADARYYTQKQSEDRFMRIDQAFSKADFDNQMALFLYSRKQIDDRLAAINPLGSPSINDPALADFKKSVLDSVALMLAGGGKQPPPDLPWTNLRTAAGTADSPTMFVRMIGGVMEFKGTLSTSSISGSQNVLQLPTSFPLPELVASYPIAARLVGSNAVYTYVNFSNTSRVIGVTMAGTINEITLSGLRVKAAY